MIHLVTAVVKPHKLEDVVTALKAQGAVGLTLSEVQGFGRQGGKSETFRGTEYQMDFVPKIKVEVLVADEMVDEIIGAIQRAAHTGKIGDGKVWSFPVSSLLRVRTAETDADAL